MPSPDLKPINIPELEEISSALHYSPGLVCKRQGLLFVSGQAGLDEAGAAIEDPEQQYVALFETMGSILERAGASFADVADVTSYHVGFETIETFLAVKDRYFMGPDYPAWTAVGISMLDVPGLLVEIKCTAVLP